MAVKELFEGREGGDDEQFARRYTRLFRVTTDSKADGPSVVTYAPGIPALYESYVSFATGEVDLISRCKRRHARQTPINPLVWEVTCEYETRQFGGPQPPIGTDPTRPGSQPADDPTFRPPTWRWVDGELTRACRKAFLSGAPLEQKTKALTNSAGMPYDPPPNEFVPFTTLEYERYELTYDAFLACGWRRSINTDPFQGFLPGEVQLVKYSAEPEWFGSGLFYKVSYAFNCINSEETGLSWDIDLLDAGQYKIRLDGRIPGDPIIDPVTGSPVNRDWPLDGNGMPLTPAQIAADLVVYRKFFPYRRRAFGPLNITL